MEEVDYFCHPAESGQQVRGFESLMGKYHNFLINYLRQRFSSSAFDLGELEEFAQRTWCKAWEYRTAFCAKNPRDFRSWLFTIGIHEVLQDFRKKRPGEIPEKFEQQDLSSCNPDELVIEKEQRLALHETLQLGLGDGDLHKCMERLKQESPKWFDALVSKILDDSAEEEILDKHQIDRPTLSRWRWKAAQKVKQCIAGGAS